MYFGYFVTILPGLVSRSNSWEKKHHCHNRIREYIIFFLCYITLWDLPLSPIQVVNWCKLKPPTRLIYFGCGESFWFQSVYVNVFIVAMASGSMSRSTFYLVWLSWLQVSSSFLSKNVPIKRNTFSLSAVWTHLATGILRIPGTWLTSSSQRCLFWSSWLLLTCRLIQVCCEL